MSGFPEEYRTLVTGMVILIFAAARPGAAE